MASCHILTRLNSWFVSNREDDSRQQLTSDSTHAEHQNRENSAPGAPRGPGGHRVIRQAVKDHSHEVREARKQVTWFVIRGSLSHGHVHWMFRGWPSHLERWRKSLLARFIGKSRWVTDPVYAPRTLTNNPWSKLSQGMVIWLYTSCRRFDHGVSQITKPKVDHIY